MTIIFEQQTKKINKKGRQYLASAMSVDWCQFPNIHAELLRVSNDFLPTAILQFMEELSIDQSFTVP